MSDTNAEEHQLTAIPTTVREGKASTVLSYVSFAAGMVLLVAAAVYFAVFA